jgi:hypothetical protein
MVNQWWISSIPLGAIVMYKYDSTQKAYNLYYQGIKGPFISVVDPFVYIVPIPDKPLLRLLL